jgi:hypothetical protein
LFAESGWRDPQSFGCTGEISISGDDPKMAKVVVVEPLWEIGRFFHRFENTEQKKGNNLIYRSLDIG